VAVDLFADTGKSVKDPTNGSALLSKRTSLTGKLSQRGGALSCPTHQWPRFSEECREGSLSNSLPRFGQSSSRSTRS